jgi:hypothetical protein
MRKKLFSALFLFAWATLFLSGGIIGVSRGRITPSHWGIRDGPDVTPQSDPSDFWGGISICFVFAAVGFFLGIRDLISYLRGR